MYISVLDYLNAKVVIVEVEDNIDVEEYVSEHFGLDNTEYMAIDVLKLEIYKD